MNLYYKLILIILGIAYLVSPADIIPEVFIPYIGWIDDTVVIATLLYFIRYGRLPKFSFNKNKFKKKPPKFKQTSNQNFSNNKKQNHSSNTSESNHTNTETSSENHKKTAHEILGVKETATKEEIQQAYKEKIKKYHPDKLSHLGAEFADLANKKFLEIKTAYDKLMDQK